MRLTVIKLLTFSAILSNCGVKEEYSEVKNTTSVYSSCVDQLRTVQDGMKYWDRFVDGYLFSDGWDEITDKVLSSTPSRDHQHVSSRMNDMKYLIGCEWAQVHEEILTSDLQRWGASIKDALRNPSSIKSTVDKIYNEVITKSRFYQANDL